MRALIFGATGMIGQGVLRECLLADEVEQVTTIGRSASGQQHPKLRELVHAGLLDYSALGEQLAGLDAVFFCLGVSSAGMSEADYTRVTHDIPVAAAQAVLASSPGATFIYVSGAGADSSEQSRTMWARVKGRAENAVLALPLRATHVFRPAFVQPLHGIRSRTRAYRILYAMLRPVVPLLRVLIPKSMTTTETLGRAMINVARDGADRRVLENHDIDVAGHRPRAS